MKDRLINKKHISIVILLFLSSLVFSQTINKQGVTILERFSPPNDYVRINYKDGSFQQFIRMFPLKPFGSPVRLYNGNIKQNNVHVSIFDMELLNEDLIQCADAIMKLRAEYLYKTNRYNDISFTITNGMVVPFLKFSEGYRVIVDGNKSVWKAGYKKGITRDIFDTYLRFIYMYAGTYSLSMESEKRNITDIQVGDYFIKGGSPGHAVMVVDLAKDKTTGKMIMLLGQSYMPSQEFHILNSNTNIAPWYYVSDSELYTPEWSFGRNSLMSFE